MFVEVKTKSPNDMAQLLTLFQESDQDLLDRYRRMAVATDNLKVVDLIDDFICSKHTK